MGKYLKSFANEGELIRGGGSKILLDPSVTLFTDSKRVCYKSSNNFMYNKLKLIDKQNVEAGDIYGIDNITNEKLFFRIDSTGDTCFDITPIGIVVIPTSHDVYGTGECAIVSLQYMDYNNPNIGVNTPTQFNYLGLDRNGGAVALQHSRTNISLCHNQTSNKSDFYNISLGEVSTKTTITPTEDTVGIGCLIDNRCTYKKQNSNDYMIPSLYTSNGNKNTLYQDINPTQDVLNYFDGKFLTQTYIDVNYKDPNWKTSSTLQQGDSYATPFLCSWRYRTKGTKQGDWYIPTIAELLYIQCRNQQINNTYLYLSQKFEGIASSFVVSAYPILSSSYLNKGFLGFINMNKLTHTTSYHIPIAFMRV